jgi:hypothetical protein
MRQSPDPFDADRATRRAPSVSADRESCHLILGKANAMQDHSSSNRPVWLAIIVIVGVLAAAGAALLFPMAGADATRVLTAAGASFVATVTLSLAAWNFVSHVK